MKNQRKQSAHLFSGIEYTTIFNKIFSESNDGEILINLDNHKQLRSIRLAIMNLNNVC